MSGGRKSEQRQRSAVVSVRFTADELAQVQAAAGDAPLSGYIRALAFPAKPAAAVPARTASSLAAERVSICLVIGPGDTWQARVGYGYDSSGGNWRRCCEAGHGSPEEAAAHGSLLAAQALSAWARALVPPAIGALILAGQSAA